MHFRQIHRWDVSPKRAAAIQRSLRGRLVLRPRAIKPRLIAGADVSCDRRSDAIHAAVVVLAWPGLALVESARASGRARFPYIPGYLSFREIPVLLKALRGLSARPDLILCDGQGIAHPRGFGLASHLGLILGIPSIGCAKTRLVGEHDEPASRRGSTAPLTFEGRTVGAVVRTRDGVKPIYVSPGNGVGVRAAVAWSLACSTGRRIPEPTRLAHIEVSRARALHNAGLGGPQSARTSPASEDVRDNAERARCGYAGLRPAASPTRPVQSS